jgi:hypothetical protein
VAELLAKKRNKIQKPKWLGALVKDFFENSSSSQLKPKKKFKLKKIKKIFTAEKRAYFHHKHGTYFRKNRKKQTFVWASSLLTMCGCFLFVGTFLVPLIKASSYMQARQDGYQAQDSQQVSAEDKKLKPISRNNSELEAAVKNELNELGPDDSWSVYIYDLKDDSSVQISSDKTLDAASLYKLFLIEYLEQKLPYDAWVNTWLTDKSVADCVYDMLRASDDPCSEDLGNYLNLEAVDNFNQLNDYKNTSFAGHSGKQTSAADVGKLFVGLKKGQILSDNARRFVFDALYQQDIKRGIPKGCGGDCRTANKQGELSDIAYDAGIVTHGKRNYALVIMSQGGSFKQISGLAETIDDYLR